MSLSLSCCCFNLVLHGSLDLYVLSFADDVCILFVHCPLFFLWWACDEPLFHSEILGSRLQVTIVLEAVMHSWTSWGLGVIECRHSIYVDQTFKVILLVCLRDFHRPFELLNKFQVRF